MVDNENVFFVIGESSTGKTSYLVAMYDKLVSMSDTNGYEIEVPDKSQREYLKSSARQLKIGNGIDRFPLETDQSSEYVFNILDNKQPICKLKCIDYKGGFLTEQGFDSQQLLLKERIRFSYSAIVIVDADWFCDKSGELLSEKDAIENIREKLCDTKEFANYYLHNRASTNKNDIGIPLYRQLAIVITKWDKLYNKNLPEEKMLRIIKEGVSVFMFEQSMNAHYFLAIFKVSLGKEISMNNYQGKYEPIGVHYPVLFNVIDYLSISIIRNYYYIKKYKAELQKLNEEFNNYKSIIDKFGNKKLLMKKKKLLLENARKSYNEIAVTLNKSNTMMDYKKEESNKFRNMLERLFDTIDVEENKILHNNSEITWKKMKSIVFDLLKEYL